MKPSSIYNFELTPSTLTTLETCDEQSIYAPGYIQPHGVLLVLQEPQLKIVQISQNVEDFWGLPAASLLGKPLKRLFSLNQVQSIQTLFKQNLKLGNSLELEIQPSNSQKAHQRPKQNFRGTLHRTAEAFILELEPLLPDNHQMLQAYCYLQNAILKLRHAESHLDLAQVLAEEIKLILGFDRVMVYRFEADEHGVVIAEAKARDLQESYLGLHYPATDIPQPSRKLLYRNWIRHIPDVNHIPAFLLSDQACPITPRIDLSDCVLRGVAPEHIEYLQNMGVAASLTISLTTDERLWGLIACHHYSARWIDDGMRKICELIGQVASIELVHRQSREENAYRTEVKTIQEQLQYHLLKQPQRIQSVLTHHAVDLLNLVHASGAAIYLDQQITLVGQTPPLEAVQNLLTWLSQRHPGEIYYTDRLPRIYSPAEALKNTASGILMVSIVLHQKAYCLLWFRPETLHTVEWAGSPQDTVTTNESGDLKLCPRKSFALWQETVQGISLPWQPVEIEAAQTLRNTLMLAVLELSQAALEEAAERAAIANCAKSQFLAKMSHELRTPLNAILGFTQLITRDASTSTEVREYLGIINRSSEHLLALINDVLEMSRIEAGEIVLTEHSFNLHRFLKGLYDMFALKASQKGLSLIFQEDPSLPGYIYSDEGKLRQILLNLISNAIKFTDQGRVILRVSPKNVQPAQSEDCCRSPEMPLDCDAFPLSFQVEDTGCGIEAENLDAIFEAFIQVDPGHHLEGTGLGLSISRQFARLMGGDVTVQSTVHGGSTFTCQIVCQQPLTAPLLEAEAETAYLVVGLERGQPAYRILVAEDAPENRQLLTILLESVGFEVAAVENGEAAMTQWQSWHPDLILMDIQMPIMNGYEAVRQIRLQETVSQTAVATHPHETVFANSKGDQAPTKIIALTAYAFESDRNASLAVGCDDYLSKPFSETALFELIARHLGVQYRYAESSVQEVEPEWRTLTSADLSVMPHEWILQVRKAALDLRDDQVRQLIAAIPAQETLLTEGLSYLVDHFQLQEIATLTHSYAHPKK